MKTIEEIINQTPIFLDYFANEEDVLSAFETDGDGHKILFAWYDASGYEGDAFGLSTKDGELFEFQGSHCSCFGLEEQFGPEKVVLKEIEHRLSDGWFGQKEFAPKLRKFLGITQTEQIDGNS